MVYKLNQKIFNAQKNLGAINKHDCVWYTFKEGEVIPDDLVGLCQKQGANIIEEKEEVKIVEEVKKPVKDKTELDLMILDKDQLEDYALKEFDVDLDKRKSIHELRKQVEKLLKKDGETKAW